MSHYLMVETHGDPLGAIRQVLKSIWSNAKLEFVLAPTNGSPEVIQSPNIVHLPDALDSFNPFKPLMTSNTAKYLPKILQRTEAQSMGVLLRPCEMRALLGMEKNYHLHTKNLLTIAFDCLGTYPLEDYYWRTERKGSPDQLTQESIQFARQGGIVPYRFRSACQVCQSPSSDDAHVNFAVIGLPIRQHIMIILREKSFENLLVGNGLTIKVAEQKVIDDHRLIVAKVNERNQRVRERIRQGMADVLPMSFEALVEAFSKCGDCQKCMLVCPTCALHMPIRSASGGYLLEEIVKWAESCGGCGMCDQVCPRHQPLSTFFAYLRDQLDQENLLSNIPSKSSLVN